MFKLGEPINEMTTDEAKEVVMGMLTQRTEDSKALKKKLDEERANDDGHEDTAAIIRRTEEKFERAVNEATALAIAYAKLTAKKYIIAVGPNYKQAVGAVFETRERAEEAARNMSLSGYRIEET